MKAETSKKIEKNIYEEFRSGSFRFVVAVYPLPKDTRTVSQDEYAAGLQWARRRRVELLEQKAASKLGLHQSPASASFGLPPSSFASSAVRLVPLGHRVAPESIRLQDVFDSFRSTELAKLAGKDAETSRLNKLGEWFGKMTLGQLDSVLIERWRGLRLSGLLGSGRNPDRSAIRDDQLQLDVGRNFKAQSLIDNSCIKPLSKHQKHWRVKQAIKHGKPLPAVVVFPVSSQTARHELALLRRTIKAYFESQGLHAFPLCQYNLRHLPD